MVIDQRNAGASVTPTNGQITLDRWLCFASAASKYTVQQNAGSVTPPVGFTNYFGATSSSAYSVGAGEVFGFEQRIEGYNVADLGFGTSDAKSITVSFWVRSSLTGNFGAVIRNDDNTRSYPFLFAISAANTWTQINVTIPGDTSGTWNKTNASGLKLNFNLGTGATYSGTANSWSSNQYYSAIGATSVGGAIGATFYITGVQLEVGTTATNFDFRDYGTELILCQRYYQRSNSGFIASGRGSSACAMAGTFPVVMRAAPTTTFLANFSVFFADVNVFTATGITTAGGSNTKGFSIDTLALNGSPGSTNSGFSTPGENLAFSAEL